MEPVAEVPAAGRGGRAGRRGRYGIDGGFAGLAVFGVTGAGLAGTVAWAVRQRRPAVAVLAGAGGAVVAGSAASYLYSTGPGKRAIWAQLLEELALRGDERVLDLGCGRGAVLMLAARRLPAGRLRIVDDGSLPALRHKVRRPKPLTLCRKVASSPTPAGPPPATR